jgi:hypothetical protein
MAGKPKVGGAVFRAPLGTALPTSARTPLPDTYIELGYVSADGWSRKVDKAYEAVNAWGGDEVSKSRTEHSVGFSMDLIENLNAATQTAKWGTAAVKVTPATTDHGNLTTVTYDGDDTGPAVWVFDMEDQGKLHRTVFPNAIDTTESFEQTFSDSDVVALPFDMSAYRDDTGTYFIDYTDDGATKAA